jgi:hypothetical protein
MDRHVHLYGIPTPGELLGLSEGHAVDWASLAGRWREAGLEAPDFPVLARRHRTGDGSAAHELARALAAGPPGFAAFQARYDLAAACSRWGSGDHQRWDAGTAAEVERVCAIAAAHGPAEVRALLPGAASPAWAATALDHLARCCARHGLALAPSLPRADSLRHWPIVAEAAARHACITGIDLSGIEDEPARHAPLAAALAAWNAAHAPRRLLLLVHVGEQLRAVQPLTALRRVWDAVALGADRLGHALAARLAPEAWPATPAWERTDERRARLAWLQWQAGDLGLDADAIDGELAALDGLPDERMHPADPTDPGLLHACQDAVLARVRRAGRIIEACPTSNRIVSGAPIAAHGIGRLQAAGVAWVVGSDDPGLLGTDLASETALAHAAAG